MTQEGLIFVTLFLNLEIINSMRYKIGEGETMTYKEELQKEIKEEKLRNLWQDICESYEQGGVEKIKKELNSRTEKIKKDYKQVIEELEKML